MSYNPDIHHRRSIRLRSYDYSSSGTYFVTIVVRGRQCLFGEVEKEAMFLNDSGNMIERHWLDLPNRFPFCGLGNWIVMPNHFHGILVFDNAAQQKYEMAVNHTSGTNENSLSRVMQAFKSLTTTDYIKGVHEKNWLPFEGKLWLRNYWDRIIRNEQEWQRANDYIFNNPAQWESDKHHPVENARQRTL